MLSFLKRVFASIVGTILGMSIFFVIFFIIIGAMFYALTGDTSEQDVNIKANSVLEIRLNAPIHEQSFHDPLSDLDVPVNLGDNSLGLIEIAGALEKARDDQAIEGLYLHFGNPLASYASLQEIRTQILKFKESGKFVVFFSDYATEKALYLASLADQSYVNPAGLVEFNGLSVERQYMKKLLDKLGLEPVIFRVGKYKSAIEPYIRENMSDASRQQTEGFLNSIFMHYTQEMADDLSITTDSIRQIAHQLMIRKPQDAADLGIITGIAYEDEVLDTIRTLLSLEPNEKINKVQLSSYASPLQSDEFATGKIAVVVAEGEIMMGSSKQNERIGSDLAGTIRKLRQNENVKAVVLRINSPGGSALASDIIWKEIIELKKEKPIVASMSDVAASGGYYMAMGCDKIVAYPTTITGSIGVFGMSINIANFMEDKIGITYDVVKTSPFADIGSVNREMTSQERGIIQGEVDRIYEDFTSKAAQGRNMSLEDLQEVAQGRVWSGEQALSIGLVDELGGLEDAIQVAANQAEIEDYTLEYYPKQTSFLEQLMGDPYETMLQQSLKKELGSFYHSFEYIKNIKDRDRIQARLPYLIELK